jgi:hypothetical protein
MQLFDRERRLRRARGWENSGRKPRGSTSESVDLVRRLHLAVADVLDRSLMLK